jgi:hypothetical protein
MRTVIVIVFVEKNDRDKYIHINASHGTAVINHFVQYHTVIISRTVKSYYSRAGDFNVQNNVVVGREGLM